MAETGQNDIRGLQIEKIAVGFADEENIFKQFLTNVNTSNREIRWYQKTAGFVDNVDTTGITASQIANAPYGAQFVIAKQSWTRNTTNVRKYAVESELISEEDIRDSDPDVWGTTMRDLVRAVENQVDIRIYGQLSGTFALSGTAAGTGWGDATNGNPIQDLLSGSRLIRNQRYSINDLVVIMNPLEYQKLMVYLITTKGSSIPAFSSELAKDGVLMKLMNNRIVVSANADQNTVIQFVPQRVAKWHTFTPIQTAVINDPGIGRKIRVWEEGEISVTDINAGIALKGC